jgi:hypothetical protein
MSIQGELKRCMKELYPDIYPDLYFDIRSKNEGLVQDEVTEDVFYINVKKDGSIFYAEAIPDEHLECYDIYPNTGHTVQSVLELCDGLAAEFVKTRQLEEESQEEFPENELEEVFPRP